VVLNERPVMFVYFRRPARTRETDCGRDVRAAERGPTCARFARRPLCSGAPAEPFRKTERDAQHWRPAAAGAH